MGTTSTFIHIHHFTLPSGQGKYDTPSIPAVLLFQCSCCLFTARLGSLSHTLGTRVRKAEEQSCSLLKVVSQIYSPSPHSHYSGNNQNSLNILLWLFCPQGEDSETASDAKFSAVSSHIHPPFSPARGATLHGVNKAVRVCKFTFSFHPDQQQLPREQ